MIPTSDPVLDAELDAYVDDQLDVRRRIEVEAHLAQNPLLASRVMADLRARDELRLALALDAVPDRPEALRAGRRLEAALSRARLITGLRRAAVVLLLVGAGWVANAQFGPALIGSVFASTRPPSYVADAVMAHRTARLRAEMTSQVETPDYDRKEIRAATAIVIPKLPRDWTVVDVQVFPSKFGPSVQMAIRTEELGLLSLYAARPGGFDVEPAVSRQIDAETAAAYWQVGEVAYAMVAQGDAQRLEKRAAKFAGSLEQPPAPPRPEAGS